MAYPLQGQERCYSYSRLPSGDHFRLLTLLPKSFEPSPAVCCVKCGPESLHTVLTEHSMSEDIQYECLSYNWGDSDATSSLCLDHVACVSISSNLSFALQRLQHQTQTRSLWIDYLCINQNDAEERKQQVQLMYQIYSRANCVIASLGEEADGSEHVPSMLSEVVQLWSNSAQTDQYIALVLDPSKEGFRDPLKRFMSRGWFTRAWVIQEVLAARNLRVLCGNWLQDGNTILKNLVLVCGLGLPAGDDNQEENERISRGIEMARFMHKKSSFVTIKGRRWQQSSLLVDLLESARRTDASDARDKVYSLLNLCSDKTRLGIIPDYTLDLRQVLMQTARSIIKSGQGHRLLLNCGLGSQCQNLPSWVPDWFVPVLHPAPVKRRHKLRTIENGTSRSFDESDSVTLTIQATEIEATGLFIDRIAHLGRTSHHEQGSETEYDTEDYGAIFGDTQCDISIHSKEGLLRYKTPDSNRLFDLAMMFVATSPRYKDKDVLKVAWKTLLCHHAGHPDADKNFEDEAYAFYQLTYHYHDPVFDDLWKQFIVQKTRKVFGEETTLSGTPDESYHSRLDQYLKIWKHSCNVLASAMATFSKTYRLARTYDGIVGMVPPATAKDDLVIYVKDMDAPLIVREVLMAGVNAYSIIGPAFFHGFMPGEDDLQNLMTSIGWQKMIFV